MAGAYNYDAQILIARVEDYFIGIVLIVTLL